MFKLFEDLVDGWTNAGPNADMGGTKSALAAFIWVIEDCHLVERCRTCPSTRKYVCLCTWWYADAPKWGGWVIQELWRLVKFWLSFLVIFPVMFALFWSLLSTFLLDLSNLYWFYTVSSDFTSKLQKNFFDHCRVHLLGQFHCKNDANSPVFYLVWLVLFENCIICFCSKGSMAPV